MPKTRDVDGFHEAVKGIGYTPQKFGERIKQVRIEQKLSQAAVGKLVGISMPAVQIWEYGKNFPSIERMTVLARMLRVDLGWLALGIDMSEEAKKASKRSARSGADPEGAEPDAYRKKALVGHPVPLREHDDPFFGPEFKGEATRRLTLTRFHCSEDAFGLIVFDKRNAPKFNPGSIIIVDPKRRPAPGDMVVVRNADGLAVGRYRETANNIEVLALAEGWRAIRPSAKDLIGSVTEYAEPL